MEAYYVAQEAKGNNGHKDLPTFFHESVFKLFQMLMFYFWPGILLVIVGIPLVWRRTSVRLAVAALASVWFGLCLEAWPAQFHYSAPVLACTLILTVEAARALYRKEWFGRPIGPCIVWGSLLLTLATLALRLTADVTRTAVTPYGWVRWATSETSNHRRGR